MLKKSECVDVRPKIPSINETRGTRKERNGRPDDLQRPGNIGEPGQCEHDCSDVALVDTMWLEVFEPIADGNAIGIRRK